VTVAQVINLTGQNDAPVLSDTSLIASSVAEDAGAASGAVGFLVSDLATSSNITDADTNDLRGFAIVATDSTQGTWSYSINSGTAWTTFTATDSTARLLAAAANTRLHFQPTAQWNGTLASALTVRAWDRISGSNGGTADLSSVGSRGGTTSLSTTTDTISLTVTPVNDAPVASGSATLATVN
jgi:hypothetical protein